MARLEDLEFRITASTTELRSQLNAGSAVIDKFARDTESSFGSLQNRFTAVAGKLRSVFALFGVGFGVRAFAGWIEGATKLDKLTESQAEKIAGFKAAMEELNASTDDLAQTVAVKLAPALENAAKFWRELLFPTDQEKSSTQLDDINRQIGEKARKLFDIQEGKVAAGGARGQTRESTIAQIQREIEELRKQREALMGAIPDPQEVTIAQAKWNKFLDSLGVDTSFGKLPAGMAKFDFGGAIRDVQQSAIQEITPADLVSKRPAGMLTFDYDKAISQVKEFNKGLEESDKRAKAFADSFASAFESRGIEALLDGDISGAIKGLAKDFAELVIRLAVLRPLAESMASSLTGVGLGSLLGFASGGRPPMGMASVVGENGPELFVPDVPGRILSNAQSRMALAGGGDTFSPTIYVQAGLPPQWEAQLMGAGQATANAVYEAVMSRNSGRR